MNVLRSSFYGMSIIGADEQEPFDDESTKKMAKDTKQRGLVVDKLNIKNILELT